MRNEHDRDSLCLDVRQHFGARLVIMDEPTSALGVKESRVVLRLINADHALAVGDKFVVLIHGSIAATFARGERSREAVMSLMTGAFPVSWAP